MNREIKKGDKVWYRWAHNIGHIGLRKEIIREIITLEDGTKIVRHSEPNLWWFLAYPIHDTEYKTFYSNISTEV